jgi:hypothetical protein
VPAVVPDSRLGGPTPAEELSWDTPIPLHAESRAPGDHEPATGFLFRLHADPACTARLAPQTQVVARRYDHAKAADLCEACTTAVIPTAQSSVVRHLRDAERTLQRMRSRASDGPMPREMVQCRAIRFEAESAVSLHPDAGALAARVAEFAGEVMESLREVMHAYDRRR